MKNMKKVKFFLSNFPRLEDSVIKSFVYNLSINEIQLTIETRNTADEWCLLTITFVEIKEVKFEEINTSNSVIYSSVIDYVDTIGYVFDFSPYSTESNCLEDYRKSAFYIACKDFASVESPLL